MPIRLRVALGTLCTGALLCGCVMPGSSPHDTQGSRMLAENGVSLNVPYMNGRLLNGRLLNGRLLNGRLLNGRLLNGLVLNGSMLQPTPSCLQNLPSGHGNSVGAHANAHWQNSLQIDPAAHRLPSSV